MSNVIVQECPYCRKEISFGEETFGFHQGRISCPHCGATCLLDSREDKAVLVGFWWVVGVNLDGGAVPVSALRLESLDEAVEVAKVRNAWHRENGAPQRYYVVPEHEADRELDRLSMTGPAT